MIDVHIHAVAPNLPGARPMPLLELPASSVAAKLRDDMKAAQVDLAFAMGELGTGPDDPLGVNRTLAMAERVPGLRAIGICDPARTGDEHFRRCEAVLAAGRVVALKCYLGYVHYEPAHANYRRYYELAAEYRLPVMFHTGDTYSQKAKLKYAHPLGIDEVAVDHPDVPFLMCHIGNPWTIDCAEVVYKNANVWADLSGLIIGHEDAFTSEEEFDTRDELAWDIQRTIRYSEKPDRFVYGTDWPLVPMSHYRDFIREAVPHEWHDLIFEENALRLFRLDAASTS
jgi:predicted TIM-barrel fold metal-dependent hydrolase